VNKEKVLELIKDLENDLGECEFGSVCYDFIDAELQSLYFQLDQMVELQ
jgi:hypothetical protein